MKQTQKTKAMKHVYYTFEYPNGKQVLSGGNAGVSIFGDINHDNTKVGDVVKIHQFNNSGSSPSLATIIGKLEYEWNMSKPIRERKSAEITTGVGYNL